MLYLRNAALLSVGLLLLGANSVHALSLANVTDLRMTRASEQTGIVTGALFDADLIQTPLPEGDPASASSTRLNVVPMIGAGGTGAYAFRLDGVNHESAGNRNFALDHGIAYAGEGAFLSKNKGHAMRILVPALLFAGTYYLYSTLNSSEGRDAASHQEDPNAGSGNIPPLTGEVADGSPDALPPLQTVPEPETLLLFGVGFAAAVGVRRLRVM